MNEISSKALLPSGLRDVLPPDAAFESEVVAGLLAAFEAHGYERVKPPLVEFEDSLLAGAGAATAADTFRLMDPVSQRMMGVRSDMTVQVARIAETRLANAPRPLRLSYAGPVLRVKGTQLRPERELVQAGIELIGSDALAADAEIVTVAVAALEAAGVSGLSVDLNMPTLVPALCAAAGFAPERALRLRRLLDRKDAAAVAAEGGASAALLLGLLDAGGPADKALPALARLDLPAPAAAARRRLVEAAEAIWSRMPGLALTIDAVEHRGFEYHSGVTFSLFAAGQRGELGRGGRYVASQGRGDEPATGCTLLVDALMGALPRPRPKPRLFVPEDADAQTAARLREQGWITVAGLAPGDAAKEARRLGCTHVLRGDEVVPLA